MANIVLECTLGQGDKVPSDPNMLCLPSFAAREHYLEVPCAASARCTQAEMYPLVGLSWYLMLNCELTTYTMRPRGSCTALPAAAVEPFPDASREKLLMCQGLHRDGTVIVAELQLPPCNDRSDCPAAAHAAAPAAASGILLLRLDADITPALRSYLFEGLVMPGRCRNPAATLRSSSLSAPHLPPPHTQRYCCV
jgi:hypothetical protein